MAADLVVVKEGYLKCPPFDKEVSFEERWPRYWCAIVAHSLPTGQSHYFLYVFSRQPRNICHTLAGMPGGGKKGSNETTTSKSVDLYTTPASADDSIMRALPLRNCYYLRRCHQHTLYKNLFSIVFSHKSYFLAPGTGNEMENWVIAFCEHLDVNCEEDQQPRPRRGRMQQNSLSNFHHSSLRRRFQVGGDKIDRPSTLPFPSSSTTGHLPPTTISGLMNPPTSYAYSSPSTGSVGSSNSSLSTGFSSDLSLASSSHTAPQQLVTLTCGRRSMRKPSYGAPESSTTSTAQSTDDDESSAPSTKEVSGTEWWQRPPSITTHSPSQDSLSQVDSGVSDGRTATPSSTLSPDGADIVTTTSTAADTAALDPTPTRDNPFIRTSSDQTITQSIASQSSSSYKRHSSMSIIASCALNTAVSDAQFKVQDFVPSACMPHRTSAILSDSLPQMAKSCDNLKPSRSFSYGAPPADMLARRDSSSQANSTDPQHKCLGQLKGAAELGNSSARASPALAPLPLVRSMINVKLSFHAPRTQVLDHLLLVDVFNSVWVGGWNSPRPSLDRMFHVGDRILSINGTACAKALSAMTAIQSSGSEVEFQIVRTPLATEMPIKRQSSSEILGLVLRKSTITNILTNTSAARSGVNLHAQGMSGKLVLWVVTQINSVPVQLFNAARDKVMEQLNTSGFHITLLLQPKDFIKALKKKVRSSPHGKQFIIGPASSPCSQAQERSSQPINVHLPKCRPTLGIFVKSGAGTAGQHNVTVERVDAHGAAHADGFLKKGMEILSADGASLVGLTLQEAAQILQQSYASDSPFLDLVVKPLPR